MTAALMTQRKACDLYGIREADLLQYELEGLVCPLRVGQDKYYSAKEQIRIKIITKGIGLGFSIAEIKSLISTHFNAPQKKPARYDVKHQIVQLEKEKEELLSTIDKLQAENEKDSFEF